MNVRSDLCLLAGLAGGLIGCATGCSLKAPSDQPGLHIRLAPSSQDSLSGDNALGSVLESFGTLSFPAPAFGLSDLNCFAVNARGGTIPGSSACDGTPIGILAGMQQGLNSEFQMTVPISDGLTFDAFGMSSPGGCPSVGDGITPGNSNTTTTAIAYKLGTVTAAVANSGDTVTIPVSFNASSTIGCGTSTPIFTDSFDFCSSSTLTALSTANSSKWTSPTLGELNCQSPAAAEVQMPLSSKYAVTTAAINTGLSHWVVQMVVDFKSGTIRASGGTGTLNFVLGLSDNANLGAPPNVIGCNAGITSNLAASTTVSAPFAMNIGGGSSGSANPPQGSPSASVTSSRFLLTCEIVHEGGTTYHVVGHVSDGNGNEQVTPTISVTSVNTFSKAYIGADNINNMVGGSYTGAFAIDNVAVFQDSLVPF